MQKLFGRDEEGEENTAKAFGMNLFIPTGAVFSAFNEPWSASTEVEVWTRNRSLMRIEEANSGPPKNVGLGPIQVNQMQEPDYNAGHCG